MTSTKSTKTKQNDIIKQQQIYSLIVHNIVLKKYPQYVNDAILPPKTWNELLSLSTTKNKYNDESDDGNNDDLCYMIKRSNFFCIFAKRQKEY